MNLRKLALVGSPTAATAAVSAAWLRTDSVSTNVFVAVGSATPRSTMRGSAGAFTVFSVVVLTGAVGRDSAIADVDSVMAAASATAVRPAGAWLPVRVSLRMNSTLL